MNVLRRVQRGLKSSFRFSGGGGGLGSFDPFGWSFRTLPGSQYDYRREAGLLWENSVVGSGLRWLTDNWAEPKLRLVEEDAEGNDKVVKNRHNEELWRDPCPDFYDESTLWAGTIISYVTNGNAYWYKIRAKSGKLVGFVYIPHFMMEPRWNSRGGNFIGSYEYRTDVDSVMFKPEDIVHFRQGLDPTNQRKGMSWIQSCLREVCTENEAGTYQAAMLRNFGVPGVVISPSTEHSEIAADQVNVIRDLWKSKFTGDMRGEPFVSSMPIKIDTPGFSPADMAIDTLRDVPVSRICAAMGIDPMVLGLPTASKTYDNLREAREAATQNAIMPMQTRIALQLTQQVAMTELIGVSENVRYKYDYSKVSSLQTDENMLYSRLQLVTGTPFLTPNEARARIGKDKIAGGDELAQAASKPDPNNSTQSGSTAVNAKPDRNT